MSLICDTILAVGVTFFGLCESPPLDKPLVEDEDGSVWEYTPAPLPEPIVIDERKGEEEEPEFAPQVIIEYVEREPEPAPEPIEIIFPEPPEPALVVSRVLSSRRANRLGWSQTFTLAHQSLQEGSDVLTESSSSLVTPSFPASFSSVTPNRVSLRGYESYEGSYKHSREEAGEPVNNAYIITPDRYVTGVLETGLNSQIAGKVIIQVDHHVFGYHGRNILIPKGSRMICDYSSPEKVGVTRLAMSCHRILISGNRLEIYGLSSKAGDGHGRVGVGGAVDNRFWEKYGTALLLTALSASVQVGAKVSEGSAGDNSVTKTASDELSKRFGEITASVLQQAVDIRPVITISQGTRIHILPENDWYINLINLNKGDER